MQMDAEYGEMFEEMSSPCTDRGQEQGSGCSWRMRNLWSRAKAWGFPLQRRPQRSACSLNFSRRTRRRLNWARQTCSL